MKPLLIILCFCLFTLAAAAQETAGINMKFISRAGTPYTSLSVEISSNKGYKSSHTTNKMGEIYVELPINDEYHVKASNNVTPYTVKNPNNPGMKINRTFSYDPRTEDWDKKFAYSPEKMAAWERFMRSLPDTVRVPPATGEEFMVDLTFTLQTLDGEPLANEFMVFTGRKFGKSFKVKTSSLGMVKLQLPKGDTFDLNFKYDRGFEQYYFGLSDVSQRSSMTFMYEGSSNIERRVAEEKERIKAEEKRLKEVEKEFEEYRATKSLSVIEATKQMLLDYMYHRNEDTAVLSVLDRNKHWKDKLIVTDLTGSMIPYASQLLLWYKLNFMHEQKTQFVFFNDGDNKPDQIKKIGSTGGIYYHNTKKFDSLLMKMAWVSEMGGGGDCAENNMEALIKGVEMCKEPFKEIVMIADNNAPVKDIELLEQFNLPVRIILCGVSSTVQTDYLKLAWKTKGSVHTMEEDILSIARLIDGQVVTVNGITYRLMKGRFVQIKGA